MIIKAISEVNQSYAGKYYKKGDEIPIKRDDFMVLKALGRVRIPIEKVETENNREKPSPKNTTNKQKKTYKTRDMKAE